MIQAALIGLIVAVVLFGLLYLALWELRVQRRVRRASWDLANARPGFLPTKKREQP